MSAIAALEAIAKIVESLSSRVAAVEAANAALQIKVAEHDKQLQTPLPPGPPASTGA